MLDELVGGKGACVTRGAAGGQRVVRAGNVVADGLGGPLAHEDGAGVADGAELLHGAVEVQLKMLGRDDVDGLNGLGHGVADDDEPLVSKGSRGDFGARGLLHVALDGGLHRVGIGRVERDQVAACQRIVLGLRHQIDGDHRRVGRLIGHDAHLRRTGDHVNPHVAGNDLLRSGNECVARAGDLGDRLDRLGAVGQRGHGLRASDGVDFRNARQAACFEHHGIDGAVLGGRGDAHDALDAGNGCRQGVHEHRRGIQRAAARHVNADAFERRDLRADERAVLSNAEPGLLDLALVKFANLLGRLDERGLGLLVHLVGCSGDGLGRHAEIVDLNTVELCGQLAQGRIALLAHLLDDARGGGHRLRVERARALEVLVGELLVFAQDDATHGSFFLGCRVRFCFVSFFAAPALRGAGPNRLLYLQFRKSTTPGGIYCPSAGLAGLCTPPAMTVASHLPAAAPARMRSASSTTRASVASEQEFAKKRAVDERTSSTMTRLFSRSVVPVAVISTMRSARPVNGASSMLP